MAPVFSGVRKDTDALLELTGARPMRPLAVRSSGPDADEYSVNPDLENSSIFRP
jgi:hypothetical protein